MVKKINEKRKEKPGKVAKYEGKTKEQIIAAEKRKLGGIYKKLDEKTKKEQIVVDGNTIDIIQYELDAGNEENVAQFAYEDVFYTINATMKEADFKELLNNLYFF